MGDPVVITIREGQGYLMGVPPEAEEALKKATRFRPEGYQYDWRFQKGKWDGWVKLVKDSKFPAGLAHKVTTVLDRLGVPYEVSSDIGTDTKPKLYVDLVGVESRWYQDNAVEAALLHPRGSIRAPTGSGKTAIGARIIAERKRWALVVVPTIDLLYQYKHFLEAHMVWGEDNFDTGAPLDIGQLGDGVVDPQPVTIATARTAAKVVKVGYTRYEYGEYDDKDNTEVNPRQLHEWINKLGTLIVDESHILGAQVVYDVATKTPTPNKYGMSASPWRDDGADLMIEAATGPEISRINTKDLVESGFLVPPIIKVIDTAGYWQPAAWGSTCTRCGKQRAMTQKGPEKVCGSCGNARWRSEFQDAYRNEIVQNPARNALVAREVAMAPKPSLVLVKQKDHGKILVDTIGTGAQFLSGESKSGERNDAWDAVRDGTLPVPVCTTIADMGLDLPGLRSVVLAGGGKSSTRHLQRIGRGARPYPDKDHVLIVDFDDGHVHRWFRKHAEARRKIERAEWGETALWI